MYIKERERERTKIRRIELDSSRLYSKTYFNMMSVTLTLFFQITTVEQFR